MRKFDFPRLAILVLCVVTIISLLSLVTPPEPDKTTGTVQQVNGVYVYYLSTPKSSYDYLGSVSKSMAFSSGMQGQVEGLIKKAKKDFNGVDAIVIKGFDFDKADAIKFKN